MGQDGELLTRYERGRGCWCCGQRARDRMFIRQVPTGENSKTLVLPESIYEPPAIEDCVDCWQRFCILSNVEGQKYTIGKTFTCREEQGEFIFLSATKGNSVCEISIERNKYFITPTARHSEVTINDVRISKKSELHFGDNLSLDKSNRFLFKERELNPEAFIFSSEARTKAHKKTDDDEGDDAKKCPDKFRNATKFNGVFTPGQNGLILSHILSYLSVDEVKSARFVSKLWNEEAFKILKKRCQVLVNFNSGYESSNESMKLFRYFAEMGYNILPRLSICIPGIGTTKDDGIDSSKGKPGAKLLEDLSYYLFDAGTRIKNIKRLEIRGRINSKSDYELRIKLFQALGKQLEELEWGGNWDKSRNSGNDYPFPEDIGFPKLRVFILNLSPVEKVESAFGGSNFRRLAKDCSSFSWLQKLAKAITRVNTIQLKCPIVLSLEFLNCFNKESVKLFSNLNELTLHHINMDVIRILLKLDQRLKKLELYEFEGMKKQDFQAFAKLLSKHATTLESLQFIIPPSPVEAGGPVFISFPTFPKLVKLNVGWGPEAYNKTEDIKLTFPDGSGFVNYGKDLPALQSLTLWPVGYGKYPQIERSTTMSTFVARVWKDCGSLYEMFFPAIAGDYHEEMEICKTVHCLDVMHKVPVCKEKERTELFPETAEVKIAAIFPNVRNNTWINSIRERGSNSKISKSSKPKVENEVDQPILGPLRSSSMTEGRKLRPRPSGGETKITTPAAASKTSRNLRSKKR